MDLPPAEIPWSDLEMDLTGVKIGLQLDAGCGIAIDPQVIPPVEAAARAFEAAGAIVEPLDPWMNDEMLHGLDRFWRIRAAKDIEDLPPGHREKVLPVFLEWVAPAQGFSAMEGLPRLSANGGHPQPHRGRHEGV